VIAWNASREATRAVHDALPILAKSEKVTVFAFEPRHQRTSADVAALVAHLKQHGIAAGVNEWSNAGDIGVVDALFSCLDYEEADLIVAGAYGHAHWLEGLFGGVSRDLIRQESMPVFMSH
jgi:nucleotide-binding universal stress UspA family protein